jgi:transposase
MLAKAVTTIKDAFTDTTPPQNVQTIRDLLSYQKQLEATLHAEQCRFKMDDLPSFIRQEINQHILFLEKHIEKIKKEIITLIEQDEALSQKYKRLQKVAGVGPVIAVSVIAFLPEIGHVDRRKIASLAGLAPHIRNSGTKTGKASTQGGRKALRKALYMGALVGIRHNAILKSFYAHLVQNGRPKLVALIPSARKLLIHLNSIEKNFLQT